VTLPAGVEGPCILNGPGSSARATNVRPPAAGALLPMPQAVLPGKYLLPTTAKNHAVAGFSMESRRGGGGTWRQT